MAAFEVITYGRFWVITEASRFRGRHLPLAATVKEMDTDGFETARFEPNDLSISQISRAFAATAWESPALH